LACSVLVGQCTAILQVQEKIEYTRGLKWMVNDIIFFFIHHYYNILAQLQYKVNFLITLLGVSIDTLANVLVFYIIFYKFHTVAGWTFWQILFLYGILLAAHGLVLTFSLNLWRFSDHLINGTLDRFCVRPRNILLQLISSSFSFNALSFFITGITLVVTAWIKLNISLSLGMIFAMILTLISSSIIELSLTLVFVSLSFWVMNSSSLVHFHVQILNEFLGYPLKIYNRIMQIIFTFIYPIAFMNYYPSLFFFKQSGHNLTLLIITPIVAISLFFFAVRLFFKGMKKYQSTGS
jgi:ABC-2 type transport system permease protein